MAQDWHRQLYDGVPLPVSYYAGGVRDSDNRFPELVGYEVSVGFLSGAPSAHVSPELTDFERRAQIGVSRIDEAITVAAKPITPQRLGGVIAFCAMMHGEWIRIHPFANGNDRTAAGSPPPCSPGLSRNRTVSATTLTAWRFCWSAVSHSRHSSRPSMATRLPLRV